MLLLRKKGRKEPVLSRLGSTIGHNQGFQLANRDTCPLECYMIMEELTGVVERLTFQSPETGYTVAKLLVRGHRDLICVVGTMATVQPGETIRCQGEWKQHLVHGRQFEVHEYRIESPADVVGIEKYLGSGLIAGIGPTYAKRIVETYGIDTLNVIDQNPQALLQVRGIGKKTLDKIIHCWSEQKTIREVMIFLRGIGISPAYAQKIYKVYGSEAIQKLKDNPYRLATDVRGIGFRTADAIARNMGIAAESVDRLDAGIEFTLSELSSDGHVCYPRVELLPAAEAILEVPLTMLEERLKCLAEAGRLVCDELDRQDYVWLKALFLCEQGIGRHLRRLSEGESALRQIDTAKAVAWAQERLHISLADKQAEAVAAALNDKVHIITGGPGTGKSTITNCVLAVSERLTTNIILAAPTGRASKRMAEICHRSASTIHSLLEYDFRVGRFKRDRNNPLECDVVIIDEASMIDTHLMYSLLRAIPTHARVLFVGDIHQLPSVGPGNVLRDMITAGTVGVTMLTEIFRQAKGSRIVVNAHRINAGEMPSFRNKPNSDYFFIQADENEDCLNTIVDLVARRLPAKYHLNPITDIQVLAPMKKGILGTGNLNILLQQRLNTSKHEGISRFGNTYKPGDKVMQLRNNYKREVLNGDIGTITKIDAVEQELLIEFDGRQVEYRFSDLDEISLAYAASVHKSQGSEFPCVVIPVTTSHFKLLHRNLIYTAVTRGKKLVVLVGSKKAVAIAVRNDEVKQRYTGLRQALVGKATK